MCMLNLIFIIESLLPVFRCAFRKSIPRSIVNVPNYILVMAETGELGSEA